MANTFPRWSLLAVFLPCWAAGPRILAQTGRDDQGRLAAEIRELGGLVDRDKTRPDWPVFGVDVCPDGFTDARLASLLVRLKGLTELRSLDLSFTSHEHQFGEVLTVTELTDDGLRELDSLTTLTTLRLALDGLTDAGLARVSKLSELRELEVWSAGVTDAGLAHLEGLARLRSLKLQDTAITDAGIEHLARLPDLRVLRLTGNNGLVGSRLASLGKLRNLRELHLARNGLGDESSRAFKTLKDLEKLTIVQEDLTDKGFKNLTNLRNLNALVIACDKVGLTDAGLAYLGRLTELRELEVWSAGVTDAGLAHLEGLARLESLRLGRANVTDAGVTRLEHILPRLKIKR